MKLLLPESEAGKPQGFPPGVSLWGGQIDHLRGRKTKMAYWRPLTLYERGNVMFFELFKTEGVV